MFSRRYTIVLADRTTGVVRRFTISLRPTLIVVLTVVTLPILIGTGAAMKARYDVAQMFTAKASLEFENANYRAATEQLASQIVALQAAMSDLGEKAALDPQLQSSMEKLPALIKSRAMGGPDASAALTSMAPGLTSPENTFALLKDLLQGLESSLVSVRSGVDKRNQLAAATPSIWPTHGWLSSSMGNRVDPLTGGRDFHPGLDISADKGDPVYATADGKVTHAASAGNYGNLVIVEHGYGLETRYGHLSTFKATVGQQVKRGDLLGLVGSTGRTTGPHLHYEVRANGRILNPLRLLQTPRPAGN
jgi:murein DD-endopeptidase MepM/ murein hydrolase activator NlpD